jgi:hypothetical protein
MPANNRPAAGDDGPENFRGDFNRPPLTAIARIPQHRDDELQQLHLFAAEQTATPLNGPLDGLAVYLDRHCQCGATVAVIGAGKGPHVAELRCPDCSAHRQWLPREAANFLGEIVAHFGRPTEPIRIFEQVQSAAAAIGEVLPSGSASKEKSMMDMRKYSGSSFLKVDDVRDGPRQMRIAAVSVGKYDKPDLEFETGDKLSVNSTNNRMLVRAYGPDSDGWIGHVVELRLGQGEFQDKPVDVVEVRPISKPEA